MRRRYHVREENAAFRRSCCSQVSKKTLRLKLSAIRHYYSCALPQSGAYDYFCLQAYFISRLLMLDGLDIILFFTALLMLISFAGGLIYYFRCIIKRSCFSRYAAATP